jgi:hypothetical protein
MLTVREEGGDIRIRDPQPGADIVTSFLEIGAAWDAEHKRLTEERHARGEFTWAEHVEASYLLRVNGGS